MKESLPKSDHNKMNRRDFLKLGIGAAAAGVVGTGAFKVYKVLDHEYTEFKKHEKLGEAVVFKKEKKESATQFVDTGDAFSVTGGDEWKITLKIGEKEKILNVSKGNYEKYNKGDKISVKYDDRNMRITEILDKDFK